MAIRQSNILDEIPLYIDENSFDHLLSLQALTAAGWGTGNKLYSYLGELVGICIYAGNKKYQYDRKKMSCSLITENETNGDKAE
jgi:hypothetical protein